MSAQIERPPNQRASDIMGAIRHELRKGAPPTDLAEAIKQRRTTEPLTHALRLRELMADLIAGMGLVPETLLVSETEITQRVVSAFARQPELSIERPTSENSCVVVERRSGIGARIGEIEAAARAIHRARYYPRDLWETPKMCEAARNHYRNEAAAAIVAADEYRAAAQSVESRRNRKAKP